MNIYGTITQLFALLMILGCSSAVDVDAEQQRLLEADRAFSQASIEHGAAEAFRMYLAEDALMLPAGSTPITGRETIFEGMASGPGSLLTWEPQLAEVARSGELGWTWGTYEVRPEGDLTAEPLAYGKYVNVWRTQSDGTWKVIVDTGNSSPAPE
ncbi:YybH family protein [Candidatus Neomarinimicrobiota bacterium]